MPSAELRRTNRRKGVALVEFSIVLLAMLTVLFGILEIGRLALTYTTLASAARSGVRYAIVHGVSRTGSGADGPSGPADSTQVVSQVKLFTVAASMKDAALNVAVSYPNGNGVGSTVIVEVSYSYTPMLVLVPLTVTLGSTSKGYICF